VVFEKEEVKGMVREQRFQALHEELTVLLEKKIRQAGGCLTAKELAAASSALAELTRLNKKLEANSEN
jgi:hypothetical protein